MRFKQFASKKKDAFYDIYGDVYLVKMCGITEEEIWVIELEEHDDGPYYGWQDTGEEKVGLIYPNKILFGICFAYGVEAEVSAGRGKVIRMNVVGSKKIT